MGSEIFPAIYEVELASGLKYVGKTGQVLWKRLAQHLLGEKEIVRATRVFLNWGGLSQADAEATVVADPLRGVAGKVGSESALLTLANKISPAKGISRLCPP